MPILSPRPRKRNPFSPTFHTVCLINAQQAGLALSLADVSSQAVRERFPIQPPRFPILRPGHMSNLDLFNLLAAKIFALLYERFPVLETISPDDLANQVNRGTRSIEDARLVASHTLNWLSEAGYVQKTGDVTPFRYVLSPKGFESLNVSLKGNLLSFKSSPTIGEQLIISVRKTVSDATKEELKGLVKKVIGLGVALGIKTIIAS